MANILCLYYSRTGSTKAVMEQLAKALDAELAEYTDGKPRAGAVGYLSACLDSFKRRLPSVRKPQTARLLREYEAVVIGMPVWVEGPCCVGKGFLDQYGKELPERVYFVVTHMGENPYEEPIRKLDGYLRTPHLAHLSVSTKREDLSGEIRAFAKHI